MTITADYQAELRSLTIGAGTAYRITRLTGLGTPGRSGARVARVDRPGVIIGRQQLEPAVVIFNVTIVSSSISTTGDALYDLAAAFRPDADGDEVALDIRYPGSPETVMRLYGTPEGLSDTWEREVGASKVLDVVATFTATDPLKYGAQVTSTTNGGTAPTDRATITITGTGGTPSITNTSDSSGQIVWNTTLAAAATRIVNLRDKTVVDGSGVDRRGEVLNTSTWFRFQSGANSLTVSGCSQSTALRPAWF